MQDKLPSQLDKGGVARVWEGKREEGWVKGLGLGGIALLTKLISCNLARSSGPKVATGNRKLFATNIRTSWHSFSSLWGLGGNWVERRSGWEKSEHK